MSEAKPCGVHNDEGAVGSPHREKRHSGKRRESFTRVRPEIISLPRAIGIRIAKPVIRSQMSHPQLCNLACAARRGILVTFTAGLRVAQRSQPIRHILHTVKLHSNRLGGFDQSTIPLLLLSSPRALPEAVGSLDLFRPDDQATSSMLA